MFFLFCFYLVLIWFVLIVSLSLSLPTPRFPLTLSRSLSGPTANSPTLATLSGDLPTPFNLTTSGHQFLVRWSSDHGTNKKGFKIRYVGEYQSMYPNFILLLLYIIILHGNKDRGRQRQTERQRVLLSECSASNLCWQIDHNWFNVHAEIGGKQI